MKKDQIFTYLILYLFLSSCGYCADFALAPAVRVINARRGKISRWLATSGFVVPRVLCSVATEVDGRVLKTPVDIGDNVSKGDELVSLENLALDTTLRRAKAVLALRQATLERTEAFREAEAKLDLSVAKKDAKVARAELEQTKVAYESKAKLSKTGMVPGQELQTAKAAYLKAAAQVDYLAELVKHRLQLLNRKDWQRDVDKAKAERDAAKEDLARAQLDVDRLSVKCPISGTVAARKVARGQSVRVGAELVTVIDSSSLFVDCYLDEQMITTVKVKQLAHIFFDGTHLPILGEVQRVAPSIDSEKGGYLVRLLIKEKKKAARAGRYATCRILLEERRGVLLLPRSAILDIGGRQALFVVAKGKASEQVIETGLEEDDKVEIMSGINLSQKVVIEGAHGLTDGQEVRVVGEGTSP